MNHGAKCFRFFLALLALAAYLLLPVLAFINQGVALYMASGATLGVFFCQWLLLPCGLLILSLGVSWVNARGIRIGLGILSLISLATVGLWASWLQAPWLPIDADWLLSNATALRTILVEAGSADNATLVNNAWANGLPAAAWGYWVALAAGIGVLLMDLAIPSRKRRKFA